MHILALSGSLRAESSCARLLRAAAKLAPHDHFTFYDQQLANLPAFSPNLDAEGAIAPEPVADLRALFADAEAVFIACPEYAHGVPGACKNALDWLVSSGELTDKPLALLAASPSGAQHCHAALVPTLRVMGARLVFDAALVLPRQALGEDGRILDPLVEAAARQALSALQSATVSRAQEFNP